MPTVKTHGHSVTTGAIKNAFGGLLKEVRHYAHEYIHEVLVDLLYMQRELHPGVFAVMDGTVVGDGAGPRTMLPREGNLILASADSVAIDAIAARIMGFDPLAIPYLRMCHERGLGVADPREIEIVGDDVADVNFRCQTSPEPRDLGRPADPARAAAAAQAPAPPLAARRLGALRLERLPRPPLVPDGRPGRIRAFANSGWGRSSHGTDLAWAVRAGPGAPFLETRGATSSRIVSLWRNPCASASRRAPRGTSTSAAPAPRSSTGSSPATTAGAFLLRIEDTDRRPLDRRGDPPDPRRADLARARLGPGRAGARRPVPGYFRQTSRLEIYREHAERLLAEGRAYRCYCTPEELEERRAAAQARGETFRYDGRCRDLPLRPGVPAALRLRIPDSGVTVVPDLIHGEVTFDRGDARRLDPGPLGRDARPTTSASSSTTSR